MTTLRAPSAVAGSSSRVLLVDDDAAMCETIAACLVRRGFEVVWRTSAQDALAFLQCSDFEVMVTDLNMGGMDGLALCRHARISRPDFPVIITSAFGTAETRTAALRAGALEFISKPFNLEALRAAVRRAVQSGIAAK